MHKDYPGSAAFFQPKETGGNRAEKHFLIGDKAEW